MITKHLLCPHRVRHVPSSFSWVDHRLVRHDHFRRADHRAWSLYLFLVTVADAEGLSYYSDRAIGRHLQMDPDQLATARQQLIGADLLAFAKPLYQVLSLPEDGRRIVPTDAAPRSGQVQSVAEVLRRALEGGRL